MVFENVRKFLVIDGTWRISARDESFIGQALPDKSGQASIRIRIRDNQVSRSPHDANNHDEDPDQPRAINR